MVNLVLLVMHERGKQNLKSDIDHQPKDKIDQRLPLGFVPVVEVKSGRIITRHQWTTKNCYHSI